MGLLRVLAWLFLAAICKADDHTTYSDAEGRQFWNFAYWAASTTPDKCVTQNNPGWQVLQTINVQGSPIFAQAQGVLAVNIAQKLVIVYVRGPESAIQFTGSGFQYLFATPPKAEWDYGLQVAAEYKTTWDALWGGGLRSALNKVWDEYCDFKILTVGHSVGSCIAQMVTIKIFREGMWDYDRIMHYSYSAPRCGTQSFAYAMDQSSYHRYRLQYQDYVVTAPPMAPCTASSPAPTATVANDNCYWHCCYAIKYTTTGWIIKTTTNNPTRCATSESTTCVGGWIGDIMSQLGFFEKQYGILTLTC